MKLTFFFLSLILFFSVLHAADNPKTQPLIKYPATEKIEHSDTYFGTQVDDPYQWLENDTSAATEKWVEEENKVTFDYLSKIPYRDQLKERFKELYDFDKIGAPVIFGNIVFYYKKTGLQNQPVIYIQKGFNAEPEVFIDPNVLDPKGLSVYELNGASYSNYQDNGSSGISDDGKYVAVTIHRAGSDWEEMQVYDIETKQPTGDKLEWLKFSGASWYKDGFFYSGYKKPASGEGLSEKNEYQSVYYHKLGDPQEKDQLVYRDPKEPLSYNNAFTSEDGDYLFLYRALGTYGNEIYWRKTSEPGWDFKPLFTGAKNQYAIVDEINGKFLVYTDEDASNGQLVSVDPLHPEKSNWKKIIPEEKNALLDGVYTTGNKLFSKYLQNACSRLYVYNLDGSNKKEIVLPGNGNVKFSAGRKTDQTVAFTYTSFNYPVSIFTYDLASGYAKLFLKPQLKFEPNDFESRQVWYTSKDGTKVSMFIVYKKGLVLNGNNPTYLYGYGGFNISQSPVFSASRILMMENGGVLAIPNLRGGSEYGEEWHKAGMLMKKQNVFDDFISAAEYLIKQKYTSSNKLAISGGSNGGLLVGACMVQRPDLFKVAFPAVGVMDMLKFHKFTVGWGWVPEYGSSEQSKEMFEYLKGYSPYHNLKKGTNYPATMVTTADHDDRVVPAHSFKFAARLQEYNNGPNPVLIRIGVNAGHGAGKPTSKTIEEVADQMSFFFWNMGYKTLPQKKNTWQIQKE